MTLGTHTRTIAEAVHSIWEEWSSKCISFRGELSEMQAAFRTELRQRLNSSASVETNRSPLGLGRRLSDWSFYDIAVQRDSQVDALLELSLDDTNVPHVLHNGELKLLGNCDGIGLNTGRPYWEDRGFSEDDVQLVQDRLSRIPVRALFFVGPARLSILDIPFQPNWWPTREGYSKYSSALLAPKRSATLRESMERLASAGLYCWFYSLCGEERLALKPPIM